VEKVLEREAMPAYKLKGPELGISGPCTQRVGGGRGLAARDAVCVVSILAISDLLVQ
jgi:hypothetical protein